VSNDWCLDHFAKERTLTNLTVFYCIDKLPQVFHNLRITVFSSIIIHFEENIMSKETKLAKYKAKQKKTTQKNNFKASIKKVEKEMRHRYG